MSEPEYWFYHLESQPLQMVLPALLEKTISRRWRAILRFSTQERLETIDSALWTYRDDSFLPHGTARDGHSSQQPIYLTVGDENPNGAEVLFLIEAAVAFPPEQYRRVIRLFDDLDGEAKALARSEWRDAKSAGHDVSYWKQAPSVGWVKSA